MALTNVTSLQRRLQEWTQQPTTERNYRRGPVQMIETALTDPRRTTQLSIAGYLLGTWHLGCGEAAVLGGDATGWDQVRLGAAFQRTALLLRGHGPRHRGRRGDAPVLPVLQTANCTALGLALDDPDGDELWARFAELPDAAFASNDAWPLFVRELLLVRAGRRPVVGPRLSVYGEILQLWTGDSSLLSRRLATLLDHHLTRTRGAPGRPAEFDEPGVLLFPVEVLAVRSVRRGLELPWPKVEHPLMFTNLLVTTPVGAWPEDPLLARMTARVRR